MAAVAATASGPPDYGLDAPRIVRSMFSRAAWTLGIALVIYFINRAEYPGPAARMCGVPLVIQPVMVIHWLRPMRLEPLS